MKLSFFEVQKLIEEADKSEIMDFLTLKEIDEIPKDLDLRTIKLTMLLARDFPEITESEVNASMLPHELKYQNKDLSLETLKASEFIFLDSNPDWNEFFELYLNDYKKGDFISYFEANAHLGSFIVGLKK